MRIIQKTINHFFSLNTYPLSFVIIQQQISADRLLGEKSVSRFSRICEGEKIWSHKVENFFLSVWKKPLAMNGTGGAGATAGAERCGGNKAAAWRVPIVLGALFTSQRRPSLATPFLFLCSVVGDFMASPWAGCLPLYDDSLGPRGGTWPRKGGHLASECWLWLG